MLGGRADKAAKKCSPSLVDIVLGGSVEPRRPEVLGRLQSKTRMRRSPNVVKWVYDDQALREIIERIENWPRDRP